MRAIDADTLIAKCGNWYCEEGPEEGFIGDIKHLIDAQPTIEPRKGKWIDEGVYADGHGAHAFRCSECGGHIIEYDADPFCRWCGADLRGEQK